MNEQSAVQESFATYDGWRKLYFPDDIKAELDANLEEDSEELGVALANGTFDRLLNSRQQEL